MIRLFILFLHEQLYCCPVYEHYYWQVERRDPYAIMYLLPHISSDNVFMSPPDWIPTP
jgi:hypothetical protein